MGINSSPHQDNLRNEGEKEASSASLWPRESFRGRLAITTEESGTFPGEACPGRRIRPNDNQLDGARSHKPYFENHDADLQIDPAESRSACYEDRIVTFLLAAENWTFFIGINRAKSRFWSHSTLTVENSKKNSTFNDL